MIEASDAGPGVITQKVSLRSGDDDFKVSDGQGEIFTIKDYLNPSDPNHLMYYAWRWFAQAGGGRDEVIRHALAREEEMISQFPVQDIPVTNAIELQLGIERERFFLC